MIIHAKRERTISRAASRMKTLRRAWLRSAQLSIMDLMNPLLARAKREGLVLINKHDRSQRFQPHELQKEWAEGRYIWGPENWLVRSIGATSGPDIT